ncbi:lipocalin family protein [Flavobacterium chungbukense]|uniref:Lipocalin-like domain-containing protein n=1 Tax=Flavobacterium chungbukense TaxID=877464 RepID=A0ABP7YN42_9FLAO|nr:lipocalin family protein [Flavobacterium chungbukense]MCC4919816.1 lipocalin family protein [Flavobacterium chungbukense]
MKNKAILLGLLSIGFFATSCSSDDNEGETIVPLQGKYNLRQTGSIVGGQEVLVDAAANQAGCSTDYLDLRLSNAAVYGDYNGSNCALVETTGTYVRSHNDLTLTINGVTTTSDIMNLTNKELKLKDKTTGFITVYSR